MPDLENFLRSLGHPEPAPKAGIQTIPSSTLLIAALSGLAIARKANRTGYAVCPIQNGGDALFFWDGYDQEAPQNPYSFSFNLQSQSNRPNVNDHDLSSLLASWPMETGKINARRITGVDGRSKLQIRIDLGVLQMEMEGRPDGVRPEGFDSLLDLQKDRLRRFAGDSSFHGAAGFVLSQDECKSLREEAVQYYHRYVGLFALADYAGVLRDTQRNLELLDLCREFGETETDRTVLEQFRPQVLMMRARSEAEISIAAGQPKQALAALDRGLNDLRAAFEDVGKPEAFDQANEVQLLRGMRDALVPKLPASQKVELQERLRAAIDSENYELAAILRDELRMLDG